MIKNLSQLKKFLIKGAEYEIVEHCRTECIGEHRKVYYANTMGFYSIDPNNPENKINKGCGGKGLFLDWNKASFWEFRDDGVCAVYSSDIHRTANCLIIAFKPIGFNNTK